MTPGSHPLVPRSTADRVAWGSLALGAAALVEALAAYWGANPGHADRFLVLLGAAYAAYTLSPAWSALPVRPRPVLGLPLVLVGVAAFPVGYFLYTQIGPRPLVLWWLTAALLSAAREMRDAGGFGWIGKATPGAEIVKLLG